MFMCIFCSGSKGNLKSVSMITISESDNWEINSSSGMKYGQFVDWEKIDPEPAQRYQQILKSGHQQLKTMGREGFWAMPHTLRAKAYYHIIHSINSRLRPHILLIWPFAISVCNFRPNSLNVYWCYICSGSVTPDRDIYYELAKNLFGEQKVISHPVPEYMEAVEIPRYGMMETCGTQLFYQKSIVLLYEPWTSKIINMSHWHESQLM